MHRHEYSYIAIPCVCIHLFTGYYMLASGSAESHGETAILASPMETLIHDTIVTFQVSIKLRAEDPLAHLHVLVINGHTLDKTLFDKSTSGFQSQSLCVRAGEVKLVFMTTWGLYSSPFIVIDNVTVTGLACDRDASGQWQSTFKSWVPHYWKST